MVDESAVHGGGDSTGGGGNGDGLIFISTYDIYRIPSHVIHALSLITLHSMCNACNRCVFRSMLKNVFTKILMRHQRESFCPFPNYCRMNWRKTKYCQQYRCVGAARWYFRGLWQRHSFEKSNWDIVKFPNRPIGDFERGDVMPRLHVTANVYFYIPKYSNTSTCVHTWHLTLHFPFTFGYADLILPVIKFIARKRWIDFCRHSGMAPALHSSLNNSIPSGPE